MNDDLQTFIEPELEARIVALVLGEASAFEAEELERLMAEKPELNTFRTGLEKIHGVVGEAHREQDDSEWKLSEDMRGKIQAKIEERKRDEMVEARRKRISRIAQRRLIYTCAACLVLTLVILGLTRPMGSMKKGAPMMAYSTSEGQQMDSKGIDLVGGSNSVTQAMDKETLSFEWKSDGKDLEKWNYSKDTPETWDRFISEERSKKGEVSEALADLNDALAISPVEPKIVGNLEEKAEARFEKFRSGVTGQPTASPSAPKPASPAKRGMVASNSTSTAAIKVPEIPDPASDFGDGFGIVDNEGLSSGGVVAGGIGLVTESVEPGKAVDNLDLKVEESSWGLESADHNGRGSLSEPDPFSAPAAESEAAEALTTAPRSKKKSTVVSGSAILDLKDKEARGGEARGRQAGLKNSDKLRSSLNKKARFTTMSEPTPTPSDEKSVSANGAVSPGQAGKPIEVESLGVDGIIAASDGQNPAGRSGKPKVANGALLPVEKGQPEVEESMIGGMLTSPTDGLLVREKLRRHADVDGDGILPADLQDAPGFDDEDKMIESENFLFGNEEVGERAGSSEQLSSPSIDASADRERSVISKLNQIILPDVNFNNATVGEALETLRQRSVELDNTTVDESQKGINLVVDDANLLSRKLPKIEMKDAPLGVILDRINEATGTSSIVDEFAVRFGREDTTDVFTGATGDGNGVTVAKLHQIIIPEFQVKQATVEEAVEFIKLRSIEWDNISEEAEKGFEVSVEEGVDQQALVGQLTLKNVPLRVAVKEIARQAGCKVRVEGGRVVFFPDPNRQKKDAIKGFETATKEKTDSTFSLNVSDVSFKLAKAALSQGNWPDASKLRPEEFVNALSYDDLKPTQAEKISCEIEQGSHPFMQQRNLMRVSMSTASLGRNAATPLRLTILLDQSGSMERADRAESVQRAFALLAAQLNPNDEVTLVGFARTPRLLAERVKGNEVAKLVGFVANPLTEGGTNLEEALSTGLQLAKQQFLKGAQNRIILLTDGAANLGDAKPKNLASQVESMRRANIAFDACGVGADGLNDDVLSSLTKQGDGRYYFLDRPEDADDGFARQIAGALRPAAKNVKVQVLFNPERVSTFKLYGFEKHKLKKEDFRNDSVDAAEMAAEESGVALYHFEPMPEGRGDIGTVSVRFFDTASRQMVERTWSIPYQEEAEFFSKADPRLRLASVAALFAEKLKGSPVGDRVELKKLRQEAQLLKPSFASQTRFNELQNMLQQAGD